MGCIPYEMGTWGTLSTPQAHGTCRKFNRVRVVMSPGFLANFGGEPNHEDLPSMTRPGNPVVDQATAASQTSGAAARDSTKIPTTAVS